MQFGDDRVGSYGPGTWCSRLLQGGHELIVYDQSVEAVNHMSQRRQGRKDLAM